MNSNRNNWDFFGVRDALQTDRLSANDVSAFVRDFREE